MDSAYKGKKGDKIIYKNSIFSANSLDYHNGIAAFNIHTGYSSYVSYPISPSVGTRGPFHKGMKWSWSLITIYCMNGAMLQRLPYTFMLYTGELPVMNIATNKSSTVTYVYEKFSASFLDPMSCTAGNKCCCPTKNSYVCRINKKWRPKHDWIMAQSLASDTLTFLQI